MPILFIPFQGHATVPLPDGGLAAVFPSDCARGSSPLDPPHRGFRRAPHRSHRELTAYFIRGGGGGGGGGGGECGRVDISIPVMDPGEERLWSGGSFLVGTSFDRVSVYGKMVG